MITNGGRSLEGQQVSCRLSATRSNYRPPIQLSCMYYRPATDFYLHFALGEKLRQFKVTTTFSMLIYPILPQFKHFLMCIFSGIVDII